MNGAVYVATANFIPFRYAMCLPMWWDTKISMAMVHGARSRTTVACGSLRELPRDGLLTARDIGSGSSLGAGLGSMMPRGVSLRSIMVVGYSSAAHGHGHPVRSAFVPAMRPLSWHGSAVAVQA
jgi:hypothetical protein